MQKPVPDSTIPSGIASNHSTQDIYSSVTALSNPEHSDPLHDFVAQENRTASGILSNPIRETPLDALSRLLEQSDAQIMAYEPELRKKFGKALLASPLYAPIEQDVTANGDHNVSLQAAIMDDIPHVLIFSSLDNLMTFCEPGTNFVEVDGLDVITQIKDHFAVLNAGTNGRAFTPKDLGEILRHHDASEQDLAEISCPLPRPSASPAQPAAAPQPYTPTGPTQTGQHPQPFLAEPQYQPQNKAPRPAQSAPEPHYAPNPLIQR